MPTTYAVEEVTPAIAAGYLELVRPEQQRRRSASVVNKYSRLMRDGLWVEETPEPIAFDTDGRLVQGQHRLAAIANTGITLRLTVARGVSANAFTVLDSGVARQPGQMIPVNGYLKAGAIRIIRGLTGQSSTPSTIRDIRDSRASLSEILASYEDWRSELDLLSGRVQKINSETRVPGSSLLAVTAVALRTKYEDRVESFLLGLESGAGLDSDDSRLLLLRRAARDRLSRNPTEGTSLTVKAWNAHATESGVGMLRYSASEKFPSIVGYPSSKRPR